MMQRITLIEAYALETLRSYGYSKGELQEK